MNAVKAEKKTEIILTFSPEDTVDPNHVYRKNRILFEAPPDFKLITDVTRPVFYEMLDVLRKKRGEA